MRYKNNFTSKSPACHSSILLNCGFRLPKLLTALLVFLIHISIAGVGPQNHLYAQSAAESMEEAKHILSDFGESIGEVNSQIERTEGYYNQFRDCVTGRGDTGRECQQYIDLLYASVGIEAHEAVMDLKMSMEDILHEFESSRAFQFLADAKKGFSDAGAIIGNAKNVIDFADKFQKYNPEGARGDPTRGLRLIGEAIGGAAEKLPFPMNRIFEGYAESVVVITGKLVDLQEKIEEARQGNLGGSFSAYANAQTYFEQNFEGQDGRSTIDFFDVSSQFSLLGSDVQVFQNFVGIAMDFFVYDQSLGRNRGWIASPVFQTVYNYFEALPSQFRGEISAGYRAELLVSQAKSNPNTFIEQAKQDYKKLSDAGRNPQYVRILEEMELMDTLSSLLSYGEDAFVGLWLFSSEKQNEIQRVLDAITNYVYVNGTVFRDADAGRETAPNEPVVLEVEGGGTGHATTGEQGTFFVLTRGQLDSRFMIQAGQGEETIQDRSQFYQPGFDDLSLVLNSVVRNPVSLNIFPSEVTPEIGETVTFNAIAVFEDESTTNVTSLGATTWSTGSNSFTAAEAGETTVTVSYMGLSASAVVTVGEETAPQCNSPGEVLDDETGTCVCNTAEGYEQNEDLGKCINLDEAIDEIAEDGDEALCDEDALAEKLARLDELAASGNLMAADYQTMLSKFMKEINDQNADPCTNSSIAYTYASAKETLAEYQTMADEAESLGTELMLEGALCPLEQIELDVNRILQYVSQAGESMGEIERGIVDMENQLLTYGCDEQDISDLGDTIADRTTNPEVIESGAVGMQGDTPGVPGPGGGVGAGMFGWVQALYSGLEFPRSSISISVRLNTTNINFTLSQGGSDLRLLENNSVEAGDNVQINVPGTGLSASIRLIESDFVWVNPNTERITEPGNGNRIFTLFITVFFDNNEDEMRYRMQVILGGGGAGVPGAPGGGRVLRFPLE